MLKKLLCILLAILLVLAFAGCGSEKTDDTESDEVYEEVLIDEDGNVISETKKSDDKKSKDSDDDTDDKDDDDEEIVVTKKGGSTTKKTKSSDKNAGETQSGETAKKTCKHFFSKATCSKPATCKICFATEGTTLPHTPDRDATCLTPSTCTVCKQVIVAAKGHNISNGTCTVCGVPAKDMSKALFIGDEVFGAVGNKFSRNSITATVAASTNKVFLSTVNGNCANEIMVSGLANEAVPDNFGYVIMDGGINDCKYVETEMGSITPKGTTEFDMKTVAGGIETLFSEVTAKYPYAKKGFVITYKIGATDTGRWSELKKLAKKACEKWGIIYVDLEERDGFSADFDGKFVASDRPYVPNDAGSEVIAKYISAWMATL